MNLLKKFQVKNKIKKMKTITAIFLSSILFYSCLSFTVNRISESDDELSVKCSYKKNHILQITINNNGVNKIIFPQEVMEWNSTLKFYDSEAILDKSMDYHHIPDFTEVVDTTDDCESLFPSKEYKIILPGDSIIFDYDIVKEGFVGFVKGNKYKCYFRLNVSKENVKYLCSNIWHGDIDSKMIEVIW
jgi:hypothetical protein